MINSKYFVNLEFPRIIYLWFGTFLIFFSVTNSIQGQEKDKITNQKISIEWNIEKPSGTIDILHGSLSKIEIVEGQGIIKNNNFKFTSTGKARISIEVEGVKNHSGPEATILTIQTKDSPFSFFLRDVSMDFPIFIPDYSVVVLPEADSRSYDEVEMDILSRNLKTKIQEIESEPEVSFSSAAAKTLNKAVPTWLGISRDFRIFEIAESLPNLPQERNVITPKLAPSPLILPSFDNYPAAYSYVVGRGVGVEINTTRRLAEGTLPILHSTHIDEDIEYHSTSFVSLEKSSLTEQSVKGTHFLVADMYNDSMLNKAQEETAKSKLEEVFKTDEETVLYFRSEIKNTGKVPRYAWFKTIRPEHSSRYKFDPSTGASSFSEDSIFVVSKYNDRPLLNEEMAILLQPNETVTFEFYLPHSPISRDRALQLSEQSFDKKLAESKKYWQAKLEKAAQIRLPEKRIEEMLQAGLLHLDLITYGSEPDGILSPTIGIYGPIGTESAPITQFYNSMDWHEIAKRSLTHFLYKQHDDGLMQNHGGYMIETGAVLWSIGEYYRYTDDKEWIKEIKKKILKSSNFLLEWRNDNKIDSLRGKGYGMIAGKVADPDDDYHQFMLNGYAYLGLKRVAEILSEIDPEQSSRIRKEAEAWKKDIRESFFSAMAHSPVVPLGDGTWSPTVPPWTETTGPRALLIKKENYFSHGTFTVPDDLLGPMYLVFTEVLDVDEPASKMMLDYHSALFYKNNATFSQPYYSRHNWIQAKRGLVKPFLKTYYNTFSALADRETYTFWEHLYNFSPHKTHEEAWFLMQTRWMLYLEDKSTLKLLNTIPRKWMENGKTIELNNVQSYFGPLSLKVNSELDKGFIEGEIICDTNKKPSEITIRLPHPEGNRPVKVSGGVYDPNTETIRIKSFTGKANVRVEF